jgi:hypothetical protein
MTFLWKTARSCASLSLFKYKSPAGTKPVGLKETGSQMLPDQNRWANKALPYNLNCARAVKEGILLRFNVRLAPLFDSRSRLVICSPMTRQEIEQKMDELARKYVETHDTGFRLGLCTQG